VHLRIDDLGDLVANGRPEDDVRFVRGQLVVALQPAGQLGGGLLESVLKRTCDPRRHQVFVVLESRSLRALAANEIDRELDIHRGLQGIAIQLPIALQSVSVTDKEDRALLIDGEVHGNAFAQSVIVHVAAPRPEPAGAE